MTAVLGVVEQKTLSHLTRRIPHNRVSIGVVGRGAVEDLNAQRPLFQQFELAGKSVFNDVAEKSRVALAVAEVRAGQGSSSNSRRIASRSSFVCGCHASRVAWARFIILTHHT